MILDTSALSAMADGDPKLEPLLEEATEVALPTIVLGEYRYGIGLSRERARYEQWLTQAIAYCRVLPVDAETAERYAEVRDTLKRKGRPIPANDAWIAALARQHSVPLLSRDQHLDGIPGVKRVEW